MSIRLTTLCDNLAGSLGYVAEWGLSILVQYRGKTVLLDTGGTDAVIRNSFQNNISLDPITHIVISHGHKDHTGGLRSLLQILGPKRQVILHPEALESKYTSRPEAAGTPNASYRHALYKR